MISKFYADNVKTSDLDGYPLLTQLLIHNEAQIITTANRELTEEGPVLQFGWSSMDGQFVRFSPDGRQIREKDRTIAALLASLHWTVAEQDFNRFFSPQDEVRDSDVLPYGYLSTFYAWPNLSASDARRINNRVPDLRKR